MDRSRSRGAFIAALTLLATVAAAPSTLSRVPKECADNALPADVRIAACTTSIRSGRLSRPLTALAYFDRGVAHSIMRDDDLAIADYTTAIRLDPKFDAAFSNRGIQYARQGKLDHAVADFTEAIVLKPDAWQPRYVRGAISFRRGQYELALADFLGAENGNATLAGAPAYRGRTYFLVGEYSRAAIELSDAMKRGPHDAYTWLALAMAELRGGGTITNDAQAAAAGLDATKWPAPLVALYSGKATPDAVLAQARTGKQRCEAAFYLANLALARRDDAGGRNGLREAVAACPHTFTEYTMARAELATGGRPHVVDGVDLDEVAFNGMRFHHGHHSGNADNEEDTDLITVSAGRVGGRIVAVGRFRFTPPATGFSDEAHAFLIAGGHATWLRKLGGFAYFNDSGPGVDPWILVSFRNDRLYADVWNTQTRCERNHDWLVTTYTMRAGMLEPIGRLAHHRPEVPVDCAH
jgi:lipoprotein NlpI